MTGASVITRVALPGALLSLAGCYSLPETKIVGEERIPSPSGELEIIHQAKLLGIGSFIAGDYAFPGELYVGEAGSSADDASFVLGFTLTFENGPAEPPVQGLIALSWASEELIRVTYCGMMINEIANLTSVERSNGEYSTVELELARTPGCEVQQGMWVSLPAWP